MQNLIVNGDFSAGLGNWLGSAATTLALDSTVYDVEAPSCKVTRSSTSTWSGVHQHMTYLGANRRFRFSARVLIPVGHRAYWDAAWFDASWVFQDEVWNDIVATGAWQTIDGEFTLPEGIKNFDFGVFLVDTEGTGSFFNIDNVTVFSLDDPGQPSLTIPAETTYTDIERDLIDNEPPGLFPGDQLSVWGQVRKVYADYMQYNLADVLGEWYLNLDPSTVSPDDLPEWEYMLDTPANDALSIAARQAFLISRREQGAFTRARRQRLVEAFITATFGPATDFTPDGIPFDASGIPMYSGSTGLAGTYTIREPMDNLIPNPSFETDASQWSANGGTIVRSTAVAQVGSACGLLTASSSAECWANHADFIMPVPGKGYSASVWVRRVAGARTIGLQIYFADKDWNSLAATTTTPLILAPTGSWTQLKLENIIAPANAYYMYAIVDMYLGTMAAGDAYYIDGMMFEENPVARSYLDPAANPFSYDVRILNTITVDTAGLTRELKRITPSGISFTITSTATP